MYASSVPGAGAFRGFGVGKKPMPRDPHKRKISGDRAKRKYKERHMASRAWKDRRNARMKSYRDGSNPAYTALRKRNGVKAKFRHFVRNHGFLRRNAKAWASCTSLRCPCGKIVRVPFSGFWEISVIRRYLANNCKPKLCLVTKLETWGPRTPWRGSSPATNIPSTGK